MQPILSNTHSFGLAAASASPQLLQPARLSAAPAASAASAKPNQRVLEAGETERLTGLLGMETTVGNQKSSLKDFIDSFTNNLLGNRYPNSITLKGGATNFVLKGERIHYSDIDIDMKIDDSIDLDQLENDLKIWAKTQKIRLKSCKLVPKQFIVITIPAEPKDLDIQFTLSSPHTCTCTYNALRIEILPIIKQSCHADDDRSMPAMLKTVDDYDLEECLSDLETRRSRSKNPKEIVEGLRSYVSLLVKGVVPKSLEDEKGFCLDLYDQYGSQNFNRLQSALSRYLERHFEPDDQIGRIIYLLTYAEVVQRAYIPQLSKKDMSLTPEEQALSLSQQKEGILYDIAALLSPQLGCAASGFRGNIDKTIVFFKKCRLYLLYQNHLLTGEDAPIVELDGKEFNLIVMGEKKRFHLFTPKPEASHNFAIEKLCKTSCPLLRPRFQRLLYFFRQPTAPSVIETERSVSPVMLEPSPIAAAASAIPSNRQEVYGLIDELKDAGINPLVRIEKTNRVIELLKKIGHLPKERQNTLGRQIAENATHLIAENNPLLSVDLSIEATRLISYENLNGFPHLEQLLAYLLEKLERTVEGDEEEPLSSSTSRLDDTQKIIDFLLFSHKKMSASQKECSNQCLNRLSRPLLFPTTLDVLWKKCLSLKKEGNFSLNAEIYQPLVEIAHVDGAKAPGLNDRKLPYIPNIRQLAIVQSRELSRSPHGQFQLESGIKAIIQQFISSVLKQPQDEASTCYPHLFNSFSLVTQKGVPAFDSVFIDEMTPSFYLSIREDLLLSDWERFLPFFKAFSARIIACSVSSSSSSLSMSAAAAAASPASHNSDESDIELALLEGVNYLIKEIRDHELIQKILTEICTEPLLSQFPSLSKTLIIQKNLTLLKQGVRDFEKKRYEKAKDQFVQIIDNFENTRKEILQLLCLTTLSKEPLLNQLDQISRSLFQAYHYAGKAFYALNTVEAFLEGIKCIENVRKKYYTQDEGSITPPTNECLMVFAPYFYLHLAKHTDPNEHERNLIDVSIFPRLALAHFQLGNDDIALYILDKECAINPHPSAQESSARAAGAQASSLSTLSYEPTQLCPVTIRKNILMTKELSSAVKRGFDAASPREFGWVLGTLRQIFLNPFNPQKSNGIRLTSIMFIRMHLILKDLHAFINGQASTTNSTSISAFRRFSLAIADIIVKSPQFTQNWLLEDPNNKNALITTLKENIRINLGHVVLEDKACSENLMRFVKTLQAGTISFSPQNSPSTSAAGAEGGMGAASSPASVEIEALLSPLIPDRLASDMRSNIPKIRLGMEAFHRNEHKTSAYLLEHGINGAEEALLFLTEKKLLNLAQEDSDFISKTISTLEKMLKEAYTALRSNYITMAPNSDLIAQRNANYMVMMHEQNPRSNDVICTLAECLMYSRVPMYAKAISYLEKGDLNDNLTRRLLAFCHFGLGHWSEAIRYFEELYQIEPLVNPSILHRLSLAHTELGQYDAAIRYMTKLILITQDPNQLSQYRSSLSNIETRKAAAAASKPDTSKKTPKT